MTLGGTTGPEANRYLVPIVSGIVAWMLLGEHFCAVRAYLQRRFGWERRGVIITDSTTMPLRIGVTGMILAHSGICTLKNYIGTVDCFGRQLRMTPMVQVRDGSSQHRTLFRASRRTKSRQSDSLQSRLHTNWPIMYV